jgi:hypothetical protein
MTRARNKGGHQGALGEVLRWFLVGAIVVCGFLLAYFKIAELAVAR